MYKAFERSHSLPAPPRDQAAVDALKGKL
jgi:hypothetical protein